MTKTCPSCGEALPTAAFGRNKALPDGLSFYCLSCNRARNNAWYRKRRRSLGKEVRDLSWVPEGFRWCPSCEQAVAHENYVRNAGTSSGFGSRCKACNNAANSDAYFSRMYGLTRSEIDDLRARQSDLCAICDAPGPEHLDHDHSSGRVRRLLCQRCNQGLGLFRDDPFLLRMAALYIEGHRETHALEVRDAPGPDVPEAGSRPGEPPVGSQRRPGARGTSTRGTGRNSGGRRRERAGEADA
ncbi:UNVERIFIED_ORG: hypothetical protein E4P37_07420 [Bacillus sp. AZ43]